MNNNEAMAELILLQSEYKRLAVLAESVLEHREIWPDIPGSFLYDALNNLSAFFD